METENQKTKIMKQKKVVAWKEYGTRAGLLFMHGMLTAFGAAATNQILSSFSRTRDTSFDNQVIPMRKAQNL